MRRRLRTGLVVTSTLVAMSAVIACGSDREEKPAPPASSTAQGKSFVLGPRTSVIGGAAANDVTVERDRLVFRAAGHEDLLKKTFGDILVGEHGNGPNNQSGFLRKVQSVAKQGDQIVVATEPAYLDEAFTGGNFQMSFELPAAEFNSANGLQPQGIRLLDNQPAEPMPSGTQDLQLDFGGQDILSTTQGADPVGYTAYAKFRKGILKYPYKFDVGAAPLPPNVHAKVTGDLDLDTEIEIGFKLTGNPTGEDLAKLLASKVTSKKSAVLFEKTYRKDGAISIPLYGDLNLTSTVDFKVSLNCDLVFAGETTVVFGGKAHSTVGVGLEFDGFEISPVAESHGNSFEYSGPNWTLGSAIGAKCTLRPEMKLSLFDSRGIGEFSMDPFVGLYSNATCNAGTLDGGASGQVQAGASATVHAKVNLFDKYKYEKTCKLFDLGVSKEFSTTFTLPGRDNSTCTPVQVPPPIASQSTPSCVNGNTTDGGSDPEGSHTGEECRGGNCSSCGHDVCTEGTALGNKCTDDGQDGACIREICKHDPYCCDYAWTTSCVDHIKDGEYGCSNSCQ